MSEMNDESSRQILEAVRDGNLSIETALKEVSRIAGLATAETEKATVDIGRAERCGYPEVVYGPGKDVQTIIDVFERQLDAGQSCLATRLETEQTAALREKFSSAIFNEIGRTLRIETNSSKPQADEHGTVLVVSAGSSDLPVAHEAMETLLWMRCRAELIVDVGVAGPQRLQAHVKRLRSADAVVVVAGMEGALPSVVAGHVACPVFGVPTSVGYGAAFGGAAALLSMLNSCAANVAVVNIDAGFKGAYLAGMVAQAATRER